MNYCSRVLMVVLCVFSLYACKNKTSESKEHFEKANDMLFSDDLTNAKKEYELALQADTTNWKASYELANVCELQGDFNNSLYYFTKTIQLNPKFALAYYNRSSLEATVGEDKASAKDLNKA